MGRNGLQGRLRLIAHYMALCILHKYLLKGLYPSEFVFLTSMCYNSNKEGDFMKTLKNEQSLHVISDEEYERLVKQLEFVDSTRNSLLTFSFTAVLAVIGISIADVNQLVSSFVCLLPFCLIIPFAARISYYRLVSIHINSFLCTFCKEYMRFSNGANYVPEGFLGKGYSLIAWLINHEMVLLGVACSISFWLRCDPFLLNSKSGFIVYLCLPLVLDAVTFYIANAYYKYGDLKKEFSEEWKKYKHLI